MSAELRCLNCGHTTGYHGKGFCAMRLGTAEPRPQCDCDEWLSDNGVPMSAVLESTDNSSCPDCGSVDYWEVTAPGQCNKCGHPEHCSEHEEKS